MGWIYHGKEVGSIDDLPENSLGFIYIIRQISSGKYYIGKKLLSKAATKTVKGVKKKIRKESDWMDYWSSSPQILEWIHDASGTGDFTKEILVCVSSRGMLVYGEELALYMVGALESNLWINRNIRSKVYSSWVKPNEAKQLREVLSSLNLIPT